MLSIKLKLGIGTLFACLSFLLLSLVSPRASAWSEYQDGDYFQLTPDQIYQRACEVITPGDNWYLFRYISNNWYHFQLVGVSSNHLTAPESVDSSDSARITLSPNYSTAVDYSYNLVTGELQRVAYYDWQNVSLYYLPNSYTAYYSESVTITWGNGELHPQTLYFDYLYVLPKQLSGFEVYVCVNENSHRSGWWAYTDKYKVTVSGTYNSQPFTITYPNYPSSFMTTRIESYEWNVLDEEYTDIIMPDPYTSPSPFYQNVAYFIDNLAIESISSPTIPYTSEWNHYGFEHPMQIGLNSLLSACKEYLNDDTLTDDFLWQSWTVSILGYTDNRTYYSTILDYSVVEQGTTPDPDPGIDWNQTMQELLLTINNNKMYEFLNTPPIGYKKVSYVQGFGQLVSIDEPDFTFQPIENLDSDGVGFFSWLVNLIIDSPVGILMLFALTFLVVSAVIK